MSRAHHRAGYGVTVMSPIFKNNGTAAGILYVDDTNLWAEMNVEDDLAETAYKAQEGVSFCKATPYLLTEEPCTWINVSEQYNT